MLIALFEMNIKLSPRCTNLSYQRPIVHRPYDSVRSSSVVWGNDILVRLTDKRRTGGLFLCLCTKIVQCLQAKTHKRPKVWTDSVSISVRDLCPANAIDSPLCLYWLVTVLTLSFDNLLGLLMSDFNGIATGVEIGERSKASGYLF